MKRRTDSAFPLGDGRTPAEDGLTKREYYAALALQGLLANGVHQLAEESPSGVCVEAARFAEVAVEMADALLSELKKERI